MKLVIYSLGNIGHKYEKTRHNAGRIVCGGIDWEMVTGKIRTLMHERGTAENVFIDYKVPDTFMNETGKYILDDIKYKNIAPTNIIIIYDDIDINFAEVKLSYDRSSGGHNGVQSIIDMLGTKEFYRIRIGIGEKVNKEMLLQDYVMSNFTSEELLVLKSDELKNNVIDKIAEVSKILSN